MLQLIPGIQVAAANSQIEIVVTTAHRPGSGRTSSSSAKQLRGVPFSQVSPTGKKIDVVVACVGGAPYLAIEIVSVL